MYTFIVIIVVELGKCYQMRLWFLYDMCAWGTGYENVNKSLSAVSSRKSVVRQRYRSGFVHMEFTGSTKTV